MLVMLPCCTVVGLLYCQRRGRGVGNFILPDGKRTGEIGKKPPEVLFLGYKLTIKHKEWNKYLLDISH